MTLALPRKRLTSLFGLKDAVQGKHLVEFDFHGNELVSFEHFGTNADLRVLHAEDNRITSFLGMTKQKNLEELYLGGNPVALHPHYRVMALLTIGFSLKSVDGRVVEAWEREEARRLGPSAALAVSYGWLLDTNPRSAAEYDAIIVELRKVRKFRQASDSGNVRTIPMVMAECGGGTSGGVSSGLSVTAETVELQSKALLHFSKRVAQLEYCIRQLQEQLAEAREQSSSSAPAEGSSVSVTEGCWTATELAAASKVSFESSIQVFGPQFPAGCSCTLTFLCDGFTLHQFLSRACIGDFAYSDIVHSVLDVVQLQCVVRNRSGLIFELRFACKSVFSAVVKLFAMRCKRGVFVPPVLSDDSAPPLPSGDEPKSVINATAAVEAAKANAAPPTSEPASVRHSENHDSHDTPQQETVHPREQAGLDDLSERTAVGGPPATVDLFATFPSRTATEAVSLRQSAASSSSSDNESEPLQVPEQRANNAQDEKTVQPSDSVVQKTSASPIQKRAVSHDSDSDSPPRVPLPKRTAWRGKEIRELMINSSDSD